MANVVVSALATWNGKALKKAKQDVDVFNKQLKNLARTFGITFSAAAVIGFSKKAVKAFAEDEAAAKSLATQLTNTGNAFRISEVEEYIKALEKTFAILTDLRAPFQTLLNVTGSVDLAQRSLRSALDISAGTGASLEEVVTALASGIRGQTKGITALNTGIDKNIIATGDMNKIMAELEKKFTGQAAARLDTYAGKMDALRKSADESTKIIGTGLVDALTILSKDNSIESLSDSMENLATNTANATVALAKLLKQFSDFTESPAFKPALLALAILTKNPKIVVAVMGGIAGSEALGLATKDFSGKSKSLQSANERENRLGLKFAKEYNYYKKEEVKQIKAKTEIDKLRDKFDLERIGLNAALNAATDEETKLRIKAQLAILDNNEALAKKYNAELEAALSVNKLTVAFTAATDALSKYPEAFNKELINAFGLFSGISVAALNNLPASSNSLVSSPFTPPAPMPPTPLPSAPTNADLISAFGLFGGVTEQSLKITIDTASTGDRFQQLIAESIQAATKNGISTSTAGSL